MNNQKKFDMRMTEQDYKRLTRKARKCGLTRSGYIRLLIHDYKPREAPPADYCGMTRELKEIGTYYENVTHLQDAIKRIEKAVVGVADEDEDE